MTRIMLDDPHARLVLGALRSHVSLELGVSDALTAFHEREGESVSAILTEARDLAGRLEPREQGGHQSQLDLESWLGAVLHGPHDESWFDERVHSPLRGWSDLPTVVSVLVVGRVRQRLTEIATATSTKLHDGRERITDALARLFDLELALTHLELDVAGDANPSMAEVDPVRALVEEASFNIRNALGVIETSAYLVRRYSERIGPVNARVEHHLVRISENVERTHQEITRLVKAARLPRLPAN
jgi:hypothetical protein